MPVLRACFVGGSHRDGRARPHLAADPDDGEGRLLRLSSLSLWVLHRPQRLVRVEKAGFDLRTPFCRPRDDVLHGRLALPGTRRCRDRRDNTHTSTRRSSRTRLAPLTLLATATAVEDRHGRMLPRGARRCSGSSVCATGAATRIALVWPPVINCAGNVAISLFLALASRRSVALAATRAAARERSSVPPSPPRRSPGRCCSGRWCIGRLRGAGAAAARSRSVCPSERGR